MVKLKIDSNFIENTTIKADLIKRIKSALTTYLKHYPTEVVDSIMDEEFINTNPSYYLYYPYLFNEYFNFYDKKTLDLISISAFLYYKSVILIDDIFDNDKQTNNFQNYFIANICQEETIKILSSFFSINSSFWKVWNKRKFEYVKAFQLDKTLEQINKYEEFEDLADYKSAVGKVAVDCLYFLSNKEHKETYKSLLASHKYFYVGFQIMDDIVDYDEDVKNGQFNISKYELIKKLKIENEIITDYSLENQKKLIYLTGVSENLYIKAISYLNKSLTLLGNKNTLWTTEIKSLYNISVTHYLNISGFIKKYHTEQKNIKSVINKHQNFKGAIKNSINYITKNQLPEGCWNDFFNDAGISDVWVTSYILYTLNSLNLIDDSIIKKGKNYLVKNQCNNLWGYNSMWIGDADSTSFALLSLKDDLSLIKKSLLEWLKFQNEDGGFATYHDKNELLSSLNNSDINNVNGWLQSHFCVSAVSYLVFVEMSMTDKSEFGQLKKYLFSKFDNSESIMSYWWSSDIYAIYYILLGAIKSNDSKMIKVCENYIEKLISQKEMNIFYKSLLLNILCLTDFLFQKYFLLTKKLAKNILTKQNIDGSWEENHLLQIPHPSKLNTENIIWLKDSKGTNVIIKDYNRIFTSLSCLTALIAYEKRIQ